MAFSEITSEEWYREFLDRIEQSIGKRYFPIYRMADGEFIFCVGWRPEIPNKEFGLIKRMIRKSGVPLKRMVRALVSGKKTVWGENYSGLSYKKRMIHYIRCLRIVSENGLLALHFTRSSGRFSEQYFYPMTRWFEINKIKLTPVNYTSFYFVYALLCGTDCKNLVRERRLLLITSADDSKKVRIREYFASLGAKTVQFMRISSDRALFDRIDLNKIQGTVDLALVAAGIGSVNILEQLKPLNTVCIDIGICMEIFADSSKRGRNFTLPDQIAN